MFSKLAKQTDILKKNDVKDVNDEAYYEPFVYTHMGTLAYIGNS